MARLRSIFTTLFILFCSIVSTLPTLALACDEHEEEPPPTSYSTAIHLSELYPAPNSGEEEFIELYNSSSSAVDLNGWYLQDASDKKYTLTTTDAFSARIAAHGYLVIPNSITKITLNNSAETLQFYNPNNTLIEETSYTDAEAGLSWSYTSSQWDWSTTVTKGSTNISTQQSSDTESSSTDTEEKESSSGTTKDTSAPEKNEEKQDLQTSNAIVLNEILPNPAGSDSSDEWIEIENTGSSAVSLEGWQLTDKSKYYTIHDIVIQGGEYKTFSVTDTKISLNNSGDTIYIIDPFGKIIQGTSYENSSEGLSWARFNDEWKWTSELTPDKKNSLKESQEEDQEQEDVESSSSQNGNTTSSTNADTDEETTADDSESQTMTIESFREAEDGTTAIIEGVVTVLPGVLGSQYMYIQDDTAGIQVYSYAKTFPDLAVGDRITVSGEKSTSRGEQRIKIKTEEDIVMSGHDDEVAIQEVAALDQSMVGMLVRTTGQVLESSSTKATLDNEIQLVLKDSANIDKALLEEESTVSVTGIVSISQDELRLLPRSNEDIVAAEEAETDELSLTSTAHASNGESEGTSKNASQQPGSLSEDSASTVFQQPNVLVGVIVGLIAIIGGFGIQQYQKKKEAEKGQKPLLPKPAPLTTLFDSIQKK